MGLIPLLTTSPPPTGKLAQEVATKRVATKIANLITISLRMKKELNIELSNL